MSKDTFYMAGTEGTGEYLVLVRTARGRLGIRVLSGSPTAEGFSLGRIRVEPKKSPQVISKMAAELTDSNWKQPGDDEQQRFSIVAGAPKVRSHLRTALTALGVGSLKTEVNPAAPKWLRNVVDGIVAA